MMAKVHERILYLLVNTSGDAEFIKTIETGLNKYSSGPKLQQLQEYGRILPTMHPSY